MNTPTKLLRISAVAHRVLNVRAAREKAGHVVVAGRCFFTACDVAVDAVDGRRVDRDLVTPLLARL